MTTILLLQVTGTGYNARGEVHIVNANDIDVARESIYKLFQVWSISKRPVVVPRRRLYLFVRFQVAVLCNNAVINDEKLLGQPTEGALLFAAMKVSLLLSSWSPYPALQGVNTFFCLVCPVFVA